jgi:hypothetical protein
MHQFGGKYRQMIVMAHTAHTLDMVCMIMCDEYSVNHSHV